MKDSKGFPCFCLFNFWANFSKPLELGGIPAKIEAGLVYLKGRFYYHAWNLLYIGKWITADSLFGQIPADVTHIRFTSGAQTEQFDLLNVIGKVKIKVIKQGQ